MCGIAGIARREPSGVEPATLLRMAAAIRHRGPDGYGILADRRIGLAHVRLSILDLACGHQPMANEDDRYWITYNGELFNWQPLRAELLDRGHRFRTDTDTEVIVHAWEEWGPGMLERFNGQFAFAIYDRRTESLFLARDRFGIRPLFYAEWRGDFHFASEMKALFAGGEVEATPDPAGLAEVFTFWGARAPRTVFRGIRQLEPGGWARWAGGRLTTGRWFAPAFAETRDESPQALEELDHILRSGVEMQMRADVPVGAYLSGGLDSSITSALATRFTPHALRTFSVSFADPALDESAHQREVAGAIGSEHAVQMIGQSEIGTVFPDVVRHAETPMLRTAPAPMYLLSRLARERGITVVLTGEGADELFLGYDIFKEAEVRRFCLRQPASAWRPLLFDRLYPYLRNSSSGGAMWRRFFLEDSDTADPLFSHRPRLRLASFARDFFAGALGEAARAVDAEAEWRAALPDGFARWSTTAQAQYLEITTLLEGYLLSTQGDRMGMAHGVEGRYPFLDHRLFELAAALPARSKLRGLREKDILRRWAAGVVPRTIRERAKQPYRAPDAAAFFGADGLGAPAWVEDLLTDRSIRSSELFDPAAVQGLVRRCRTGRAVGVREHQALVGVISALAWQSLFCGARALPDPLPIRSADVARGEGDAMESLTPVPEPWTNTRS